MNNNNDMNDDNNDNNNENDTENNNEEEAADRLLREMWAAGQNGNDNADADMDEGDEGDGTLDGGVAINHDNPASCAGKIRSSDCDLVLYLSCEEALFVAPNHPILKPGVTVSIGLDKNTKLSAVFNQYVEFCNRSHNNERIHSSDLEFAHCQVLHANDTAETSALMKNDRIKVRAIRTAERNDETERKRMQRSADFNFFSQLRHMMPEFGAKYADIVLDCQGKLLDESGRSQQVLSTNVRAQSVILSKRCPWLGAIIQVARTEGRKKKEMNVTPEFGGSEEQISRVESEGKPADEEGEHDDDKSIEVMPVQPRNNNNGEEASTGSSGANEIENYDDDEDEDLPFDEPRDVSDRERSESPVVSSEQQKQRSTSDNHLLHVTMRNHPPEAVKLLLEYCYTNRVTVLGKDAFATACSVPPSKHKGAVPPYHMTTSGSRRWPKEGRPLVSFPVALGGIALAEEASMPRLSLMCEVAAAKLVSPINVVEALVMCTSQKANSGNDLPRLRKAAMEIVLRNGTRGVMELGRSPAFKRALDERRAKIIPTLLQGTTETVTRYEKQGGLNYNIPTVSYKNYDALDREDSFKRERERRKRRKEHGRSQDHGYDEAIYDDPTSLWASLTTKRSLKHMSQHMISVRAVTSRSFRGRKPIVARSSDL